jgi:hypothetical protein
MNHQNQTIFLSKEKCITYSHVKFNVQDAKPNSTLLEVKIKYIPFESPFTFLKQEIMHNVLYAQAIGSILYLVACTRHDLAYLINYLAQFTTNPSSIHWSNVTNFFHYL